MPPVQGVFVEIGSPMPWAGKVPGRRTRPGNGRDCQFSRKPTSSGSRANLQRPARSRRSGVAIAVTLINPTSALARIVFMVGMDRAALSARGYTLGPCDCNSPSGPVHPRRTPQFPVVPSGPLPRLGPRLPQSQRPHHGQQQGRGTDPWNQTGSRGFEAFDEPVEPRTGQLVGSRPWLRHVARQPEHKRFPPVRPKSIGTPRWLTCGQ